MTERPYVIDRMISAKDSAARIEQLSDEIETEFADTEKLVVVGLLRGSFVFIADLVRELDMTVEVEALVAAASSEWQIGVETANPDLANALAFTGFVQTANIWRRNGVTDHAR